VFDKSLMHATIFDKKGNFVLNYAIDSNSIKASLIEMNDIFANCN